MEIEDMGQQKATLSLNNLSGRRRIQSHHHYSSSPHNYIYGHHDPLQILNIYRTNFYTTFTSLFHAYLYNEMLFICTKSTQIEKIRKSIVMMRSQMQAKGGIWNHFIWKSPHYLYYLDVRISYRFLLLYVCITIIRFRSHHHNY